ncbi:hypothetical protein SLA2020_524790 [Shorea laevis]
MSSSPPQIVLTSSPDGPVTAYDTASGAILARFSSSRSPRNGLTLIGNSFIAASHVSPETGSGSIHLYNWWSLTASHNLPLSEPVAPLVASPDGLYLFAGGLSGKIYTLLIPSGELLRSYSAHNKPVSCLRVNEDGSLLISGGDDGTIAFVPIFQLVEAQNEQNPTRLMVRRFLAHDGAVTAIASSVGLCSNTIITTSLDCTYRFWRVADREHLIRTVRFPCAIMGVAVNQTHPELYAAGSDGSIYKESFKVRSKKDMNQSPELIRWPQKHDSMVVGLVMVNEGQTLVSAAEDGNVSIWDTETGQEILSLANIEMGSISHLVVANTGLGTQGVNGTKMRKGDDNVFGEEYGRFSVEELSRSLKEMVNLEDVLKLAERDRSRAIDMLESSIAMYERLLELILKEAKRGGSSC